MRLGVGSKEEPREYFHVETGESSAARIRGSTNLGDGCHGGFVALIPLRLGTALLSDRKVLVAPLPSAPERVVDLNRVECARLARLGEGCPESLAGTLVPASLLSVLEAGPRGLQRLRQTLAYAEKWHRRGDLPEALAPGVAQVELLPCLPRPSLLRRSDGVHLDRFAVQGPGAELRRLPQPTLAAVGQHGGMPAGFCLALEDLQGVILGAWLEVDFAWAGTLDLKVGRRHRSAPLEAWEGLGLPPLRAGEVMLLPHPRLKGLPELVPGAAFTLQAGAEVMALVLAKELVHPTVQ